METKPNFEQRDPLKLRLHPAREHEPEPREEDPTWKGYLRDVHERGIAETICVDEHDHVVSNPWPFWAARRWKLVSVPVQVVAADEIFTTMVASLAWRKHYTKAAIAYLCYPLLRFAHEEVLQRRLEYLKSSHKSLESRIRHGVQDSGACRQVQDLAEQIGIGERLFRQAAAVHKIFAKDPEYKAQMEPRILREPVGGEHEEQRPSGLGAVISGYGGRGKTKDKAKPVSTQLKLFNEVIRNELVRWEYWQSFSEADKNAHFAHVRSTATTLPADQCLQLAEYHSQLAAEFRKAAKRKEEE